MRLYNLVNNKELKRLMEADPEPRTTLSFYRYHHLENPAAFRDELYRRWLPLKVFGRVYVAAEGINAQISVPTVQLDAFKDDLYAIAWLDGVRLNIAVEAAEKSFYKLKIKLRPKIVADGLNDNAFDVTRRGRPLKAGEVNALMENPETIMVDLRNHYESEVGRFEGAICPPVDTFREALPLVEEILDGKQDRPVIFYCTGGIRCEKASAYYLSKGFRRVHMIDGGIIEYTRQCREQNLPNRFIGKNFVFDERMGERISEHVIAHCHQCGQACDTHVNCANNRCHLLFIQCEECAARYQGCCSDQCAEFSALPASEQERLAPAMVFNGTRFGHAHYKVNHGETTDEQTDSAKTLSGPTTA